MYKIFVCKCECVCVYTPCLYKLYNSKCIPAAVTECGSAALSFAQLLLFGTRGIRDTVKLPLSRSLILFISSGGTI